MSPHLLLRLLLAFLLVAPVCRSARADNGERLWLPTDSNRQAASVRLRCPKSPIARNAAAELARHWHGAPVVLTLDPSMPATDGFAWTSGEGGLELRAHREAGLLYGAFALLRWQATGDTAASAVPTAYSSQPAFDLRMLNHWDNPDLSVERGYAGQSIWKWDEIDGRRQRLSERLRRRLTIYARANASVGINAVVLNNVNAKPEMLSPLYIAKVKALAALLRTYGIRTFLSVNFASPMALGGLPTADPLDPRVAAWWQAKADELYKAIPDFGGFLVKANSEGQPGPGDYGRSHAEGANMLARALQPHGGMVVWRCFVYGANHKGEDRVKQAVSEFQPLDGQFLPNVMLQTKNGPLDFQPREPYSPVFDQITRTPNMVELQITQEYLGQSRHLVYLAPMWKEFFRYVSPDRLSGIAGVANTGDDTNWCGHPFSQANWYAFGRLAWQPSLSAADIAREWLCQTFTSDPRFLQPVADMMLASREACVDYMMPLGLHHIFKFDHHYGPEPDGFKADYPLEWCPVYYHKADSLGIGFDRSSRGTNAVAQYREPYRSLFDNLDTCPDEFLLWFHHVGWSHTLHNGLTLWDELCRRYQRGVNEVERFQHVWQQMRPYVDAERHAEVSRRLDIQLRDAREWRDVCLDYFDQQRAGR